MSPSEEKKLWQRNKKLTQIIRKRGYYLQIRHGSWHIIKDFKSGNKSTSYFHYNVEKYLLEEKP